jgi:hypothetical protein
LGAVASRMMMSASLPGVSEPVFWSSRRSRAPLEEVRRQRHLDVRAERRLDAQAERLEDGRHAVPHVHLDRDGERHVGAGVLDLLPRTRRTSRSWMNRLSGPNWLAAASASKVGRMPNGERMCRVLTFSGWSVPQVQPEPPTCQGERAGYMLSRSRQETKVWNAIPPERRLRPAERTSRWPRPGSGGTRPIARRWWRPASPTPCLASSASP